MADFFANPGAWFEQAGKDVGEALREGPKDVLLDIANGDVMQGIWKAQDDVAQVIYDVFNPNNPDPNWVVDQIENTIDQPPTSDFDDPLTNPNSVVTDDILTGSSGKDIFILTEGEDLITDFNRGEGDKISLQNFSGLIGLRQVNADDIEILVDGDSVTTVQDVVGDYFFHTLFVDSEDNKFIYYDFAPVLFTTTTGP